MRVFDVSANDELCSSFATFATCDLTLVQPMMILALLPFAIGFESTRVATSVSLMRFTSLSSFIQVLLIDFKSAFYPASGHVISPQTISLVSVGGFIAFLMECAEFLLVSYTSGLTLSVAGWSH